VAAIHETFAYVALAANALAASWGIVSWIRAIPSRVFWYVLRVAQLTVVIQVAIGFALVAEGRRPPDDLHYVYAVAPLFVALVSEAMRATASQKELEQIDDPEGLPRNEQILIARKIVLREVGIMTVGLLLVVTLLLRAASSGGLGGIL
jgi:hypothetical protein